MVDKGGKWHGNCNVSISLNYKTKDLKGDICNEYNRNE